MEEFFVQNKVCLGSSDKTLVILFIKIISIHTISFRYFLFQVRVYPYSCSIIKNLPLVSIHKHVCIIFDSV